MSLKKINTSAAWRGDELFKRKDWLTELEASDVAELEKATLLMSDRPLDDLCAKDYSLPALGKKLLRIQDSLENGCGAAMLRGFPMNEFPLEMATKMYWGIANHIGVPVSQSAAGERVFKVCDAGFGGKDKRARGPNTSKKLSFHTDRCDVIGFLCVRQAKSGGENEVVSSVAVYNEMVEKHPELVSVLMEPFLYKRHTVDLGNDLAYCRQPIFSIFDGHFASNMLRVLIERAYAMADTPAMTDLQRRALDTIEEIAGDPSFHVAFRQEPGDILFFNNFVTFHRRGAFEDHPEPERRRLLLRVWLSVPNNRPLDPAFADNYGATEAGAIRGGMRCG